MSSSPRAIAVRLALRESWRSSLVWGGLFAFVGVAIASAYEGAYPTEAARKAVAALLEGNKAFSALIGQPAALDTPGGFAEWRAGGPIMILGAVAGLLATTRLLRGEEEAGRWEQLVAGATTPRRATGATLGGYGVAILTIGVLAFAGFAAAGLPTDGSALIGTTIALVIAAFASLGALTAQLVPSRRRAAGFAGGVLAAVLAMRVLADGTGGLDVLRGLTPFGWAELVHPYSAPRPVWLVPLVLWTVALGGTAIVLSGRRDLQGGWIAEGESRRSSPRLLGSATGYALRSSIRPTTVWVIAVGAFSAVLGALAVDIVSFLESSEVMQRYASELGMAGFGGVVGFLGLVFTFLAVPVALVAAFRLGAARDEESSARLDLVLASAVRRTTWLLGWAVVALAAGSVVALAAGVLTWVATVASGGQMTLGQGIGGALNVLPASAVFVGLGVLLVALLPRWSSAISLGAVGVAELVSLLTSLEAVPRWLGDLSPFTHIAPVPAADADLGASVAMLAIGIALTAAGVAAFARRDVVAS